MIVERLQRKYPFNENAYAYLTILKTENREVRTMFVIRGNDVEQAALKLDWLMFCLYRAKAGNEIALKNLNEEEIKEILAHPDKYAQIVHFENENGSLDLFYQAPYTKAWEWVEANIDSFFFHPENFKIEDGVRTTKDFVDIKTALVSFYASLPNYMNLIDNEARILALRKEIGDKKYVTVYPEHLSEETEIQTDLNRLEYDYLYSIGLLNHETV